MGWIIAILVVISVIVWAVIGSLADSYGNNPLGPTTLKSCQMLSSWWASQSFMQKALKLALYLWKKTDCKLRFGI